MRGSKSEEFLTIVRQVDPTKLTWLRHVEAAVGTSNRLFVDLRDLSWSEAAEALNQEEALIRRIADASALPVDELDIDAELDDDEYSLWVEEPWAAWTWGSLELLRLSRRPGA